MMDANDTQENLTSIDSRRVNNIIVHRLTWVNWKRGIPWQPFTIMLRKVRICDRFQRLGEGVASESTGPIANPAID